MVRKIGRIQFPVFSGIRCLMLPYIQGDSKSVPHEYGHGYESILDDLYVRKGDIGFLTIDESIAHSGSPHRGARAKHGRALHTEAGRHPDMVYAWGGGNWGGSNRTTLSRDVKVLISNSIDKTCAVWDAEHENTTIDGDIGYLSDRYPYDSAMFMMAGEVYEIGILTPHESLPVNQDTRRQFIRIVSSGVNGREPYFTKNRLLDY
jgi:hypothetical protein